MFRSAPEYSTSGANTKRRIATRTFRGRLEALAAEIRKRTIR